jgi:hypothetical protein
VGIGLESELADGAGRLAAGGVESHGHHDRVILGAAPVVQEEEARLHLEQFVGLGSFTGPGAVMQLPL